ncbi:MAG: molybdate ABC transporter permease subunit [Alphaproteobacteria bacterium]
MLALTPVEAEALTLSLRVACWAVAASLPLGILVAVVLTRVEFPGRALVSGLVHLPLVLPPVVTGYALLLLLGRHGPLGAWLESSLDVVVAFRWTGAAIASAVMGFPLMVRAIRLSLESVDRRLESAAQTLGANRAWTFLAVTLPLMLPGVIAGAILAFAKSLGEFGATITFVSNIPGETRTLPNAIYTYTQVPGGEREALRLCLLAVALSMAALLASEIMARFVGRRTQPDVG